ncbi:hypothetical protein N865_03080 [Intrasporangium oryzae NRRL B-24470]|uniref:Polysaccharide pyruvyl transferase domain-containing protein n=1 Tax=Intrasporangium oryzae NRRL B-24470 TaxID=1386089 RepID=W9G9V5_9MICO|nr:polysaccharide pyruvyl transferase family protein [Intrasporangium oryzae]EWT02860.1 hypothetical protein N865_03080 [Intrasporangium oryzae NRRL B-24470]
MRYDSPTRRRLRAVSRLARSMAHRSSFPTARIVRAYWWDGHANFGDALTPWLLRPRGVVPVLVPPERAQVVGVGSILEHLPRDFSGLVWGTGLIADHRLELPNARFLAVRGHWTRERLGLTGGMAVGDPALLAATVLPRPVVCWPLGIIPHADHHGDPVLRSFLARHPGTVRFIDVRRGPDHVVREIASCAAVLSTSLHGLVIADSYDIPAAWATLTPPLIGDTFKFHDHESVVTPGRSRRVELRADATVGDIVALTARADRDRVSESVERLAAAVDAFPASRDLPLLAGRRR